MEVTQSRDREVQGHSEEDQQTLQAKQSRRHGPTGTEAIPLAEEDVNLIIIKDYFHSSQFS